MPTSCWVKCATRGVRQQAISLMVGHAQRGYPLDATGYPLPYPYSPALPFANAWCGDLGSLSCIHSAEKPAEEPFQRGHRCLHPNAETFHRNSLTLYGCLATGGPP